jgi:hypothetical protein
MANGNWWGRKDSIWGGETLTCGRTDNQLKVDADDQFRIEKKRGKITLIPHPDNSGVWKDFHDKNNPIELDRHFPTTYERAYAMSVTVAANTTIKVYLCEGENGEVFITNKPNKVPPGGHEDGTASVER